MRQGFNACGPVFSSAIQVMALATLLNCPSEFAEKCTRTAENEGFKADTSLQSMKDYILRGILKNRSPVRQTGSVWNKEEDGEDPPPRSRQPAPSLRRWETRRDESGEEEEQRPLAWVRSDARHRPRRTSTPVRTPADRRRELLFRRNSRVESVFDSDSDSSAPVTLLPRRPPKRTKNTTIF